MNTVRLTAAERLRALFDDGTYMEMGSHRTHRCAAFGMEHTVFQGDGVVCGVGKVGAQTVYAYAQDASVMGGSLGEAHAEKICRLMELALDSRSPVVAMLDSGGARIQEGIDALAGYGRIFRLNVKASGVIPQIAVIMGACAGGAAYSPALMDCILMVRNQSHMFVTGPGVIKAVTGESVTMDALGGMQTHSRVSGVAHFSAENDHDAISRVRELLQLYATRPQGRARGGVPKAEPLPGAWDALLPQKQSQVYDMRNVIRLLADFGQFAESMCAYAGNILTGFIRMDGVTVAVVANQPSVLAGCLDIDASDKAARFVRLCDSFRIPIVTLVDVPGFLPGYDQERDGIIRHGAKLLYAYGEASVPRVTVILRKAYGGAYLAMGCKELGADFVFAWPGAQIAVMGAKAATDIIFRHERDTVKAVRAADYERTFFNSHYAASRGMIDEVIQPSQTRRTILRALEALKTKAHARCPHGNMPV